MAVLRGLRYPPDTRVQKEWIMGDQDAVRVLQHGRTILFQVEGQVTMRHALPLRRCAERALADGMARLLVDLQGCTYMDSTFLGTLLFLLRASAQRGQGAFALVSPSPQCRRLLQGIGMEDVFPIATTEEPDADAGIKLNAELPSCTVEFKDTVVQAHRELAALPGPAGETFRTVAGSLTKNLEAEQAKKSCNDAAPAADAGPPKKVVSRPG
jgi:anti-anti-sigma factor